MTQPILYSFRRCPYAMRARLAISVAGVSCDLREIMLRDKAADFLATSPSGTVPCLKTETAVIDESLDIMIWALRQNDPEGWLEMPATARVLIQTADGPFKTALDHTKYTNRYADVDSHLEREYAALFLRKLNKMLHRQPWLYGASPCLADMAILPFVRQFAGIDRAWFAAQHWPHLRRWLDDFLASDRFTSIMSKYPKWQPGDEITRFP